MANYSLSLSLSLSLSDNHVSKIKSHRSGFTIVELLVVIVVIGILAAITIVSYTGITQRATVATLQSDLGNSSQQLKLFNITNSAYPVSITDCPSPAAGNMCLNSSSGTSYSQYAVNNSTSPQGFCITATKSSTNYKITSDSAPAQGDCQNYGSVLRLDAGDVASYPSPFNGTTWADLSGGGNNGTLNNGVGYNAMNGGALSFDGVDDTMTTTAVIEAATSSNLQTFEGWFYNDGVNAWKIFGSNAGSWGKFHLFVQGDNSSVTFGASHFGGGVSNDGPDTVLRAVSVGEHQIVVTKTAAKTFDVYIDGTKIFNQMNREAINPSNFNLGQDYMVHYYRGTINEVRIYNRPQSAAEVLQNFNLVKSRYGL